MGLVKAMTNEVIKEIGNKSREFYEFVLPPIDMHMEDGKLTIHIDLPGFDKKDVHLRLYSNILSIKAQKPKATQEMLCNQRPHIIDKKIRLPIHIKKGEETVESAKFANGVLTVVIPFTRSGKDISIE